MVLYPFTAPTKDTPIPVFPEDASIIVDSPGLIIPFFSYSSTIFTEIRSFIEPPGFMNSP